MLQLQRRQWSLRGEWASTEAGAAIGAEAVVSCCFKRTGACLLIVASAPRHHHWRAAGIMLADGRAAVAGYSITLVTHSLNVADSTGARPELAGKEGMKR